jgi:hypothetical protein
MRQAVSLSTAASAKTHLVEPDAGGLCSEGIDNVS